MIKDIRRKIDRFQDVNGFVYHKEIENKVDKFIYLKVENNINNL